MTTLSLHQPSRPRRRIAKALGRVLLRSSPFSALATLEGLVQLTGPPRVRYLVVINTIIVVWVGVASLVAWLYNHRRDEALDAQAAALKRSLRPIDPDETRRLMVEARRRLEERDARIRRS